MQRSWVFHLRKHTQQKTTHLSKLKHFRELYRSGRLLPKVGQTLGGSLPDFLTLRLAGSLQAQVPRTPPGCQGSRLPGPELGGRHGQRISLSLLRWEDIDSRHRFAQDPALQDPTPHPTALVSAVTSLVCWKRPQQPSGAGAAREVSTDSSALFQGEKRVTQSLLIFSGGLT